MAGKSNEPAAFGRGFHVKHLTRAFLHLLFFHLHRRQHSCVLMDTDTHAGGEREAGRFMQGIKSVQEVGRSYGYIKIWSGRRTGA